MFKKKVGILHGGFGNRTKTSNDSAVYVLANLDLEKYDGLMIEISEENMFNLEGEELTLEEVSEKVDIIFNCTYGKYGQDGNLQKAFEALNIPFVGSSSVSSSIAFNRDLKKEVLSKFGISSPVFELVRKSSFKNSKAEAGRIFSSFPQPCVFRNPDNSVFMNDYVCRNIEDIEKALDDIFIEDVKTVLVEEYIKGDQITVIGIENYIDNGTFFLSPVYSETSASITDEDLYREVMNISRKTAEAVGLSGHFSIELMTSEKRGIQVLKINNFPEITESSIFVQSLKGYNIEIREFIDKLIENELKNSF